MTDMRTRSERIVTGGGSTSRCDDLQYRKIKIQTFFDEIPKVHRLLRKLLEKQRKVQPVLDWKASVGRMRRNEIFEFQERQ